MVIWCLSAPRNLIFIWKHLLKDSSMTSYHNTSMIAHLMRFPAVPGKKWKWVQIKIWNDVKGISKGNGHALNTVFIAPLKWWGILKHHLQNRHNRLYKIITYFKTGQMEVPRLFYIDRKNENLGWMNSICTADLFSITQNVNQDCTINHCVFNLFHASINRNTTNS